MAVESEALLGVDDDAPSESERAVRWERWAWVIVVVLAVVLFARTLRFGLIQDDYVFARHWSWSEVFGTFHGPFEPTGFVEKYFRPLAGVSFALEWNLWGATLWGYHITNVALHAIAAVCVWAL